MPSSTVDGMIAGGQISSAVTRYIPRRTMRVGTAIRSIMVMALMLGAVSLCVR